MNEIPEESGTRRGSAAPTALPRGTTTWAVTGSVCVYSSAVRLGFASEATAGVRTVLRGFTDRSGAVEVEEGRERDCGAVRTQCDRRREETDSARNGPKGRTPGKPYPPAGGIQSSHYREASPSAGWREVAVAMDAEEGSRHD